MTQPGKQTVRARMEEKLTSAFAPQSLQVVDESDRHAGHAGHAGGAGQGGETHFRVQMVSERFAGKSRVERHRAVNEALADEFAAGLHALAMDIRAPGER